jgi:hypothetical protein
MKDITMGQTKSTWLSVLLIIVLISAALVIVVAATHSYSQWTILESGVGFVNLLMAASFLWLYRRRVDPHGPRQIITL